MIGIDYDFTEAVFDEAEDFGITGEDDLESIGSV